MGVVRRYDVVVVGSGVAGLYAAVRCAEQGLQVAVLDKGLAGRSSASYSAKGMAAFGQWCVKEDSRELHVDDTLKSGRYVNDRRLVEAMVGGAEDAIQGLVSMGMLFDRDPKTGQIALHGRMPGHTWPRDIGFSDITGKLLVDTLLSQARKLGVSILGDHLAIDVASDSQGVKGCFALNVGSGELVTLEAPVVVIATGGIGEMYPLTSNAVQNTGDGIAMALRAGAVVKDMEFVQFYPATVIYPPSLRGVNTNSIGLGAKLLNSRKERFMSRLEPEKLEQVTRDRLSQCIYLEIMAGLGTDSGGVYLDATAIPGEEYKAHFPSEWRLAEHAGLDLEKDVLEVAPAAHYYMGGIEIGPDGSTQVPGLLALGECTSGIHGANRLANNSLTEVLSLGMIGGDRAAALARDRAARSISDSETEAVLARLRGYLIGDAHGRAGTADRLKQQVKDVMGKYAGVVRDARGLATGCPVHLVAPDRFQGPAIMTAVARWMADPRDGRDRIEDASKSGVKSCASCFRCSTTCSRGIDVFTASMRFAREAELAKGYSGTATDRQMVETFREYGKLFPIREVPLSVKYGSSQADGATTGIFLGCMLDVRHQDWGERLLNVLEEAGVPFVVPEEQVCCGGPLLWKGRVREAGEAARKNLEVFKAAGVQRIVSSCPGCKLTWTREYPRLLGREALGSLQVVDTWEVVTSARNLGRLGSKTVGYFPPCHTQGHGIKDTEPPEILLRAVREAGGDYVQALLGECCGGMTASSDLQVARKLGSRVIERAVNVGLDVLVTTCPFCVENLSRSARALKAPLSVVNIVETI